MTKPTDDQPDPTDSDPSRPAEPAPPDAPSPGEGAGPPPAGPDHGDNELQSPEELDRDRVAADWAKPLSPPIVGIGASAGGLQALEAFFQHVPRDSGFAFVVITHQHPDHASLLPEILGRTTDLEVKLAEDGMTVVADQVVVTPPGAVMSIQSGALRLDREPSSEVRRLPIDFFFRSLAGDAGNLAVCVVLSGTGTDGTLGLRAVKGEGGLAIVERPESARYTGMPVSAIATGLADFVLPADEMPAQLIAYREAGRPPGPPAGHEQKDLPEPSLSRILTLIHTHTGHDFSHYKLNTVRRRIERRMSVVQASDPADYSRRLAQAPHEIDLLFNELLIGVTSFFRDPEAWQELQAHALSGLMSRRPSGAPLRVWVPGCASGEEAYSIAILLREVAEALGKHFDVQIFATDLDHIAIDTARAGVYPGGIALDLTPQRLERYFVREDSSFRIRKEIRETVIFAIQNVIKDPPFTKLDLVSCRNLLIYLNQDIQKRLLPIFHYALRPNGLLFLGPSESLGGSAELFDPIDKRSCSIRSTSGGRSSLASTRPTVARCPRSRPNRRFRTGCSRTTPAESRTRCASAAWSSSCS